MAWGRRRLWFVNTRFSCLCTLDGIHSFVPRWRPPFIDELAPEDRCHLNGLAMVERRPAFVTALGETDTKSGWRENKRDGPDWARGLSRLDFQFLPLLHTLRKTEISG